MCPVGTGWLGSGSLGGIAAPGLQQPPQEERETQACRGKRGNVVKDCKRCLITIVLLVSLAWMASARAQITPSDDAYTNTATPTTNLGTKPLLDVQSATQTTFIRFDLSSVPAGYSGASIAKATMKLYVNAVPTAGSFDVDYVGGTWTEKTITANISPALGTTIVSSVSLTSANVHDYVMIDITPAVQAWLDGTQANDGVALVANSPLNASFDSKESTTNSQPPELDIVFAGGGTLTGITTASGSGLTGGGTTGTLSLSLTNTCATNQVLQWSGSAWACAAVGTGTVSGVTAGTDLTGGGSGGNVTLNLDTTKVPQLVGANVFTGNQTVNGGIGATGTVTGAVVNAASGFDLGGVAFASGSNSSGNAFLGFSGNATITGARNTGTGSSALLSGTTGTDNTATGFFALLADTTGSNNTASGSSALSSNSTGSNNTATGSGVLQANSTGSYNTAGGYDSLFSNTVGADNTAIGFVALSYNSTGSWNTAVGAQAGDPTNAQPLTGSSNTFIGANSGPGSQTNLSNATAIGANAVVAESNALVLGNAVSVGIGTSTPAFTLDVNGSGRFTGPITFATGQIFPGTGAGTITGVSGTTGITGGGTSGSVTLGLAANSCSAGNAVTALPFTCSPFATLGSNLFTGPQTINGTLIDNGSISATGNISSTNVNANGSFTLSGNPFAFGSLSTGSVYLGFAGNAVTNGSSNAALGAFALNGNTTGGNNTASGTNTLMFNSTGGNNTAVGSSALSFNTTGSWNSALGYNAGPDSYPATLNYTTAIGANAAVRASNAMVLGAVGAVSTGTGQVNVGIGTATPAYRLDINYGDMIVRGIQNFPLSGEIANLYVGDNSHVIQAVNAKGIYIGTFSAPNALLVADFGHVGIGTGTNAPSNIFTVGQGQGHAVADGWDTYSSRRWKTNIQPLHNALTKVEQLRGVSYELKSSGKHEIGVIAEEVGAVVPEVVSYEENGKDARSVDYSRLTALLIEAMKQQQRQIEAQQKQIRIQQSKIVRLSGKVAILEGTLRTANEAGRLAGDVHVVRSRPVSQVATTRP